jgi:hypothetical protein
LCFHAGLLPWARLSGDGYPVEVEVVFSKMTRAACE